MQPKIREVHEFWFGEIRDETTVEPRSKLWFQGGPEVDQQIRERFEPLLLQAGRGELSDWTDTATGCVCLIVVLDQFPLNIYRRTARAFAFEQQALKACHEGLDRSLDRQLSIVERAFFYMPLEHSETLENQALSVRKFTQLHDDAPPALHTMTESFMQYANDHRDLISRFGRYPFRNEVLGRQNTEEETVWLADNPQRYGQ